MKLIDNINNRLVDDLKVEIKKGSKLSIAASSFSIYAFEALKKELINIEELKFIFTSPTFIQENLEKQSREFYIPHIYNESHLCGGEFEVCIRKIIFHFQVDILQSLSHSMDCYCIFLSRIIPLLK